MHAVRPPVGAPQQGLRAKGLPSVQESLLGHAATLRQIDQEEEVTERALTPVKVRWS